MTTGARPLCRYTRRLPPAGGVTWRTSEESRQVKYLGLSFGAKGLDTRRMREVSIDEAVCAASLFHPAGCSGGNFSTAYAGECWRRSSTEHGIQYGIGEFGQGVAGDGGQDVVPDSEKSAAIAGNGKLQRDTQGSRSTAYRIGRAS